MANLAEQGAEVHALTRSPKKAKFPRGVTPVKGDLMDIDATQAALAKASTLFLLNAVTPDEFTQALLTLSLAQEAAIKRIVYFSVFHSDVFTDVPHFAGKYTVERMIEDCDLPVTILRPNYFMQNDTSMKDALLGQGIYPQPIGSKGISMVDTHDIAEAAAIFPAQKGKSRRAFAARDDRTGRSRRSQRRSDRRHLVRGARPTNPRWGR